jgi:hypothetical protein
VLLGATRPAQALEQEWVGAEATPLALATGRLDYPWPPDAPHFRLYAGFAPGLRLRLLRHRWTRVYWTPIQAMVLVGEGGGRTAGFGLGTEAGAIWRSATGGSLELGLGLDLGAFATELPAPCGNCAMGGSGLVPSLVLRWTVHDARPLSVGLYLRVAAPLSGRTVFGYDQSHELYTVSVAGVDLAFGR